MESDKKDAAKLIKQDKVRKFLLSVIKTANYIINKKQYWYQGLSGIKYSIVSDTENASERKEKEWRKGSKQR